MFVTFHKTYPTAVTRKLYILLRRGILCLDVLYATLYPLTFLIVGFDVGGDIDVVTDDRRRNDGQNK